ncbi:MAG: ABC transporter ATP-binding protein, partial [Chloroflexi bacterium]|nr:ABC transporter ATP-binding protein [Chloroflexota bacterium]
LGLMRNYANEFLAQLIERNSRDELYVSLLGKSQTFHGRQRIGDVMARATNDVRMLNIMFSPGVMLIADTVMAIIIPLLLIASLRVELLLVPAIFLVFFVITVWDYSRRLNPVSLSMREQFGAMNAGLAESIGGIEVVKGSAQEEHEVDQFTEDATKFRNYFVKQGEIQAMYLPLLMYSIALGAGFFHAMWLWRDGLLTLGEVVTFMGLFGVLRFPTFISIFSFNLVQLGIASARRILELINTETDLGENEGGHNAPIKGEVTFENVRFGYDESGGMETAVLKQISFTAKPGETVAIVGQTGSGKTTLTRLINRIFDTHEGRVLVDDIDVRKWSLESLRSQISTIEQDIFLFSRTIAENIAFGNPEATQDEIEQAAKEAQAHEFIMGFAEGYETEIGERGVTLSGGQRQRLAIARAFLTKPRILVLDDSTSAIDSATEDRIQQAMRRISRRQTTFLITHRLSQIRWADRIVVLNNGELVDQGSHDELLARSIAYQRIFARYE